MCEIFENIKYLTLRHGGCSGDPVKYKTSLYVINHRRVNRK